MTTFRLDSSTQLRRNEEIYDWTRDVTTCAASREPEHTRFFRQMPDGWQSFLSQSQGKERKSALQLLHEIVSDGQCGNLCEDALALAGENGRTDADSIRQCNYLIAKKERRPLP